VWSITTVQLLQDIRFLIIPKILTFKCPKKLVGLLIIIFKIPYHCKSDTSITPKAKSTHFGHVRVISRSNNILKHKISRRYFDLRGVIVL